MGHDTSSLNAGGAYFNRFFAPLPCAEEFCLWIFSPQDREVSIVPSRIFFALALMGVQALCAWPGDAAPLSLRDAVHKHRHWLRIGNMDWKRTGAQNAVWFDTFLDEFETPGFTIRDEYWKTVLHTVVMLGKHYHLFYQNTGFIREEPALEIVLAALGEKSREVREIAVKTLAGECYRSDLERHTQAILPYLAAATLNEDEWLLYGVLALSDADRLKAAQDRGAPVEVRARVGDAASEESLISAFEKETDYHAMRRLARKLGYAGTERCAAALAKALASEVVIRSQVEDRSIRGDVLLALGHIYQTEPLFTADALFLTQNSDESFDRYRNREEYLKDVDAWIKKKFHHAAWGAGEVWFVRYNNTPTVKAPPPKR